MTTSDPLVEPAQPTAARGQRRSRARKGEGSRLRSEIMEATERLLLETGSSEAVSIRSVADAVGVTPPSIYRHFPDKDQLIHEVCARHFQDLRDQMTAAAAGTGTDDPVERLIAQGKAYVQFGLANPEPYRILFMTRIDKVPEEFQQDWPAESDAFMDVVANVQAAIDQNRFRPEHDDAYLVALGVWARVHGLTSLAVSKPFLPLAETEFINQFADACLRGIVID